MWIGDMPSVSKRQHNAMEAAAHGKSTLGIPAKVGREFTAADKAKHEHMAERKKAGATTKQVAGEFGTSKTTAHRRIKAAIGVPTTGQAAGPGGSTMGAQIQRGYVDKGSAR